MLETRVVL
jgi:hypothetical protein